MRLNRSCKIVIVGMFSFCYNDSDGCSNNDDIELCIKLYNEVCILCCVAIAQLHNCLGQYVLSFE